MTQVAYAYRTNPAVPPFPDDRPILVFDGDCVMCSGFARFVIRNDPERRIRLMAAQSATGAALYRHLGLDPVEYETNILIERGLALMESKGSIRIFELLGLPWSLVGIARIIPTALLDRLYRVIARNRLRWFGKRRTCFVGPSAEADRFIG